MAMKHITDLVNEDLGKELYSLWEVRQHTPASTILGVHGIF
jgi:hypothetical protein